MQIIEKHYNRLKRSWGRRWREFKLPRGYIRIGTRYGGWWINKLHVGTDPLLIDCGLGKDISFPTEFLKKFGGHVVGIDPNPYSIDYCQSVLPKGMELINKAFWHQSDDVLTFNMPRPLDKLPKGADGVSGSLISSHSYASENKLSVSTISFARVLDHVGRPECDVLKLDIEGAEYDVLKSLCADGSIRRAKQVVIEFHHFCTHYTIEDTNAVSDRIQQSGFQLVYVENRNYIFLRK